MEAGSFEGFFEETGKAIIEDTTGKTGQAYKVYTQDDFKNCPFKSKYYQHFC